MHDGHPIGPLEVVAASAMHVIAAGVAPDDDAASRARTRVFPAKGYEGRVRLAVEAPLVRVFEICPIGGQRGGRAEGRRVHQMRARLAWAADEKAATSDGRVDVLPRAREAHAVALGRRHSGDLGRVRHLFHADEARRKLTREAAAKGSLDPDAGHSAEFCTLLTSIA